MRGDQRTSIAVRSASAEEALSYLRQAHGSGQPFHAALLDLRMPGVNGLELAASIKSAFESGDEVVVVSEPFDKEDDWTEVPENHVLVARASAPIEIVPLHLTVSAVKSAELPHASRINART